MDSNNMTNVDEEAARDRAYRRLAAVMLRLDVATLARDLRAARQIEERDDLPVAA